MKWKDAILGYVVGRTAESGVKAALSQLKKHHDEESAAWQALNQGRELLRQGKKKEALEAIRLADKMDRNTFTAFCFGLGGAFALGYPEDEDTRRTVDEEVLAFIEEMGAPNDAQAIREYRDEFYKRQPKTS